MNGKNDSVSFYLPEAGLIWKLAGQGTMESMNTFLLRVE